MSLTDLTSWAHMLQNGRAREVIKLLTSRYTNPRSRLDVMTRIRKVFLTDVAQPSTKWTEAIELLIHKLREKPVARQLLRDSTASNINTENLYQQAKHKSITLLQRLNNDIKLWKKIAKIPPPFPQLKDFRLDALTISAVKELNSEALEQKTTEAFNLNGKSQSIYNEMVKWVLQSKDIYKLTFGLLSLSGRRLSDILYYGNFEPTDDPFEIRCTRYVKSRGNMTAYTFPILEDFQKGLFRRIRIYSE